MKKRIFNILFIFTIASAFITQNVKAYTDENFTEIPNDKNLEEDTDEIIKNFLDDGKIKIWVHGNYISSDVEPFIENDRTFVPIRFVSEALGKTVNWNQDTKTITIFEINQNDRFVYNYISLELGNPYVAIFDPFVLTNLMYETTPDREYIKKAMKENVNITKMDVVPILKNDRTFVPIRFISEALGENINWDAKNKTVIIGDETMYTLSLENYM